MKTTSERLKTSHSEERLEWIRKELSAMRTAVQKAGKQVRDDIKASAQKRTGGYSRSWSVKNTRQNSNALEVTVYSRNRYQLTHLLEFGHAKRGGGRTRAQVHIAPAEEKGIRRLEEDIKRSIRNG